MADLRPAWSRRRGVNRQIGCHAKRRRLRYRGRNSGRSSLSGSEVRIMIIQVDTRLWSGWKDRSRGRVAWGHVMSKGRILSRSNLLAFCLSGATFPSGPFRSSLLKK